MLSGLRKSLTVTIPPYSAIEEAWKVIKELTGTANASEFQKLHRERQREALRELRDLGASVRQLQRLTGLGRGLIQRI